MSRTRVLLLSALVPILAGCAKEPGPAAPTPPGPGMMGMATPDVLAPVRKPPVKQPAEVTFPDDFPVVGIVAGGKERAYSLKALAAGDGHVVNDLLRDVPVTVVYCDFVKAIRVYTDTTRGKTLDVAQVGHAPEGLLIRYNGRIYLIKTGKAPSGVGPDLALQNYPFEETTWKAWREKHPKTEIYVGPDAMPFAAEKP